jgi:hypothetical protein
MQTTSRTIQVTKIGRGDDTVRYRVAVTGSDERTLEVRVPLTTLTTKGPLEEEIRKIFSHGPLPEDGSVTDLGDIGWAGTKTEPIATQTIDGRITEGKCSLCDAQLDLGNDVGAAEEQELKLRTAFGKHMDAKHRRAHAG